MLDIKTSMSFRSEVCDDIENSLGGIEHVIKSKQGITEKVNRISHFQDRLVQCHKTLSFIDEWIGSRLLDPKGN